MSVSDSAATRRDNAAVEVINPNGQYPVLLICEHASSHIPEKYGNLGLDSSALKSHIAWDPGALGVATEISGHLDAPLVAGKISRLVYDCNRPPEAPGAIPSKSEIYDIPGNTGISDVKREHRIRSVYEPFHCAVTEMINEMAELTAIVTIHSYTRVYLGRYREDSIGILHDDRDSRMADVILAIGRHQALYPFARRAVWTGRRRHAHDPAPRTSRRNSQCDD